MSGPKARPARSTSKLSITTRRHHGTYPDSPRRASCRRVEGTQHFRRRTNPADRRASEPSQCDHQRSARDHGRYGAAARPLVWHQPGILAQSAKAVKKLATVWKSFPSSRNASASKHDEPRNLFRADSANLVIKFEFDNAILVLDTASWWRPIRSDVGASMVALERRRGLTLLVSVLLLIEYEAVMTRALGDQCPSVSKTPMPTG